jgi:anti-sigma regulatory factor (Ser/Thr protein kinase)
MPEGLPAPLHLTVPTDMAYVRPGRKMVEGLLGGQGWAEDDIEEAGLVVTELLQNAIEHGSRADGTERAELRVLVTADRIAFVVTDPGTGKDPRLLMERDVTVQVPLDAPRGRGLYLIHRLSLRLDRERTAMGGCLVRAVLECSES